MVGTSIECTGEIRPLSLDVQYKKLIQPWHVIQPPFLTYTASSTPLPHLVTYIALSISHCISDSDMFYQQRDCACHPSLNIQSCTWVRISYMQLKTESSQMKRTNAFLYYAQKAVHIANSPITRATPDLAQPRYFLWN